jgi:hypothetical protein
MNFNIFYFAFSPIFILISNEPLRTVKLRSTPNIFSTKDPPPPELKKDQENIEIFSERLFGWNKEREQK